MKYSETQLYSLTVCVDLYNRQTFVIIIEKLFLNYGGQHTVANWILRQYNSTFGCFFGW